MMALPVFGMSPAACPPGGPIWLSSHPVKSFPCPVLVPTACPVLPLRPIPAPDGYHNHHYYTHATSGRLLRGPERAPVAAIDGAKRAARPHYAPMPDTRCVKACGVCARETHAATRVSRARAAGRPACHEARAVRGRESLLLVSPCEKSNKRGTLLYYVN